MMPSVQQTFRNLLYVVDVCANLAGRQARKRVAKNVPTMSMNTEKCADQKQCVLIYRSVLGGGMQRVLSCSRGRDFRCFDSVHDG